VVKHYRWHENLWGYVFIAPWLVGFIFFVAGPMAFSALLSLYRWNGISPLDSEHATFRGLGNFKELLFDDELFWTALYNTAYYAIISVPLGICTSLLLATLLNAKLRGISIFRTLFYVPNVVAGVATIMMWSWIFNPDFGGFNVVLNKVGLTALGHWIMHVVPGLDAFMARSHISWPPLWFAEAFWAKPALIIMSMWGAGGGMLIFLASLQDIPPHLYEVAAIDGANRLRRFFAITLPLLTPTILFNLIMSIIGSFQVFAQAYLMTDGGPDNATLFYVLYLFRKAFQHFEMGYASALAWVLFAVIMTLTLLVLKSSSRWVYYEGERG